MTEIIGELYLTESADNLPAFMEASPEIQRQMLYFHAGDIDMRHVWTHVGTFKAEILIDNPKELTKQALKVVDAQMADLDQKYFMAKQELEARRANLLCLEAPKE